MFLKARDFSDITQGCLLSVIPSAAGESLWRSFSSLVRANLGELVAQRFIGDLLSLDKL